MQYARKQPREAKVKMLEHTIHLQFISKML